MQMHVRVGRAIKYANGSKERAQGEESAYAVTSSAAFSALSAAPPAACSVTAASA